MLPSSTLATTIRPSTPRRRLVPIRICTSNPNHPECISCRAPGRPTCRATAAVLLVGPHRDDGLGRVACLGTRAGAHAATWFARLSEVGHMSEMLTWEHAAV